MFLTRHQHEIGHYFQNFYRILKFVDESGVGKEAKYAGILQAQLSAFELGLLFYNALHPSSAKLKFLVERYSMLENLDMQLLNIPPKEILLFEKIAYGDQDVSSYYGEVD